MPSPPSPTDIPNIDEFGEFNENEGTDDDIVDAAINTQFMANAERVTEEEWAARAAFDVEQQHRQEAAAAEEWDDDDEWSDDGPNPVEK
jgi:hypothetical protein